MQAQLQLHTGAAAIGISATEGQTIDGQGGIAGQESLHAGHRGAGVGHLGIACKRASLLFGDSLFVVDNNVVVVVVDIGGVESAPKEADALLSR